VNSLETSNSFTVLGSSSGLPQAERACSGYLLRTGESLSLIDCGGGVCSSLLRRGFDPLKLDRVFISHTHSDHVGELPLLIQMLHVLKTDRKLDVYIPREFVGSFNSYLNAVYLIRERLRLELRVHAYSAGVVHDDEFRLEAIANSHLESARVDIERLGLPNRMQCHSFRLEVGNSTLFYSSDIGGLDDIQSHLHDLDFVVAETTHLDVSRLLEYASTSTVKQYILTHLGSAEETTALEQLITAAGVANMSLASDGLRLDL